MTLSDLWFDGTNLIRLKIAANPVLKGLAGGNGDSGKFRFDVDQAIIARDGQLRINKQDSFIVTGRSRCFHGDGSKDSYWLMDAAGNKKNFPREEVESRYTRAPKGYAMPSSMLRTPEHIV